MSAAERNTERPVWSYRTPAEIRALPHSGSPTSASAAVQAQPKATAERARVLAALADGPKTDERIQQITGLDGDAERPRRWQLVRDGLVRNSGGEAKTSSGAWAVLWELVDG